MPYVAKTMLAPAPTPCAAPRKETARYAPAGGGPEEFGPLVGPRAARWGATSFRYHGIRSSGKAGAEREIGSIAVGVWTEANHG